MLLSIWNLLPRLVRVVAAHEAPELPGDGGDLAAFIHVACGISNLLGCAVPEEPGARPLSPEVMARVGLTRNLAGAVSPDLFVVARDEDLTIQQARIAEKPRALMCREGGGLEEVTLSPEQARSPCLTEDQVRTLADIAITLEEHFGRPQDIEWTIGEAGNILILQSRPLRVSAPVFAAPERETLPEPQVPPLLNFGIRAVGGAAAGRVHLFLYDDELATI